MYSDLIAVVVSGTRRKLQCTMEVIRMGNASSWGLELFFFFLFFERECELGEAKGERES